MIRRTRPTMRRQRPRGATTREAVVTAALAIVDQVGIEALTVRAVAKQVGAPVMTLYTHFDNKGELLDLMHAEVARQLYEDKGNPTWQAELLAVCRHYRAKLVAHPKWAPLLARPARPIAVPFRDRVLALMKADGLSPDEALSGLSGAMLLAFGLTLVELTMAQPDANPESQSRERRGEAPPATVWPEREGVTEPVTTRDAFREAARFDHERNLEFVVGMFVKGLEEARHAPSPL
jgi:AcrR family transcriptional regulator